MPYYCIPRSADPRRGPHNLLLGIPGEKPPVPKHVKMVLISLVKTATRQLHSGTLVFSVHPRQVRFPFPYPALHTAGEGGKPASWEALHLRYEWVSEGAPCNQHGDICFSQNIFSVTWTRGSGDWLPSHKLMKLILKCYHWSHGPSV